MGHARALIKSDDPEALALEVINRDLSVRETEKLVRAGKPKKPRPGPVAHKDAHADIEAMERQLGDMLGLRGKITHGPDGATVSLGLSPPVEPAMTCPRPRYQRQRDGWGQSG